MNFGFAKIFGEITVIAENHLMPPIMETQIISMKKGRAFMS